MINCARIVLPLAALTSMVACASNPRVQSNYRDDLNFAAYKTFNFAEYGEMEAAGLSGDLELYVSAAVMLELQSRGLTKSDDPDLLINVSVDLEDVSRPPTRRNACPRYEDYTGRKLSLTHGGLTGASRRPVCSYKEGQITVEIVDDARNQLFLNGISRVRLDENDRGGRLRTSVFHDVATMFGGSPTRYDTIPHRVL